MNQGRSILHGSRDPCHDGSVNLSGYVKVRQGAYLPHWTSDGSTYAVCFRLADALPTEVLRGWREERAALLAEAADGMGRFVPGVGERLRELFSARIESLLDAGAGACWLREPVVADCLAKSLHHADGVRYRLDAWCVMPNHMHVLMKSHPRRELPEIIRSWKGFTARTANRLLGRDGPFWQAEYYDHLIRDEGDFVRSVEYVLQNPLKAGLVDWRWVWASDEARKRISEWHGSPDPGSGFDPSFTDRETRATPNSEP